MTTSPDRSPNFYARIAGSIHLVAMALSLFSEGYLPSRILVAGDLAATTTNLAALQVLYRAGIVVDVVVFLSDVVLAWALYQLLKPVDDSLARLGAFLRVANGAILAAVTLNGLVCVRLLSSADYLQGVDAHTLQGLARLFMGIRGAGLNIGFVFLGAGSMVFAYLLLKSRYVPRLLAGWGILASPVLALGALAALFSPWFAANWAMAAMVPMFFYEVPLGVWFLVKGVAVPAPAAR